MRIQSRQHQAVHEVRDQLKRPVRDLRISVIDNCNLRCTYCMPKETYGEKHAFLRQSELLSFKEIERVSTAFASMGVTKLRLTGGEPLLRKDLPTLISALSRIPGISDIALTTNGILLPRFATELREAGLHRVTVSLDTLDPEVSSHMSGRDVGPEAVLAGIEAAQAAGFSGIRVNSVVQKGVNDAGAVDLAEHFRGKDVTVRFIEYMDVGTCNGWRRDEVVPSRELMKRIHERHPLKALDPRYVGEVATRYAYEDGAGEVGFISSVSAPFCGDCTRARLSADGRVFTCLFGTDGYDVRQRMRLGAPDSTILEELSGVWARRADRYSEERAALGDQGNLPTRIEMYQVGG